MKKQATIIGALLLVITLFTNCKKTQAQPDNPDSVPKDSVSTVVNTDSTFTYTPERPVNGVLKGVVELGSSGFNSFVIKIDDQKRWELINAEYGNSIVAGKLSDSDIKKGLKKYIKDMLYIYNLESNNIHFVVSSGAIRNESVQNIHHLLIQMGYFVNTVTSAQEGIYALKATIPKEFYKDSFLVDIGSGNTKIAFCEEGKTDPTGLETDGSKYYEIPLTDANVFDNVKDVASQIPKANRKRCFIIGGVPFDLADSHREGKEKYTPLKAPKDYTDLIAKKGDKVRCGVNIYKAIKETTGCEQFIFYWDTNFSIGFLMSL